MAAQYKNAAEVLPEELLAQVQRHAAGLHLYVPQPEGRAGWGQRCGTRQALALRNERMKGLYRGGARLEELMQEFHLAYDSVRKIVSGAGQPGGENRSTRTRR